MGPDVTIRGANQLAEVTARLKAAGNGGARRDLLRDLRTIAKPLVGVARNAARTRLPHTGGLNEVVASSKFGIRTRTSGSTPGVRVVAVSGHDIGAMERGIVRHPVYPGPDRSTWTWATQHIEPGWWSEDLKAQSPTIRTGLIRSMNRTTQRLVHG